MKIDELSGYMQRKITQKHKAENNFILASEMKDIYTQGLLEPVTPIWNTEEYTSNKIPISKYLEPNIDIIVQNVEINFLFSVMQNNSNLEVIKEKALFNPLKNDFKTYQIVKNWKNGISLLPPTLFYIIKANKFELSDGTHRFNAAYYFGATVLPIIITKNHFLILKKLYNVI